jgi:hypothetical protein
LCHERCEGIVNNALALRFGAPIRSAVRIPPFAILGRVKKSRTAERKSL